MAGVTLVQVNEMVGLCLEGIKTVLKGQKYRIGEEEYTMANLSELQKVFEYWNNLAVSMGGISRRATFNIGIRTRDY